MTEILNQPVQSLGINQDSEGVKYSRFKAMEYDMYSTTPLSLEDYLIPCVSKVDW
jgi:hypothetical protein